MDFNRPRFSGPVVIPLLLAVALFCAALWLVPPRPASFAALKPAPAHFSKTEMVVPRFVDRTLQMGLYAQHHQRSDRITSLTEAMGSGTCVLDFDGDGWMDLFVVGGSGETRYYGKQQWWHHQGGNRLYRNIDGTQFEDVTQQAGLTSRDWGISCTAADFDNDGDPDL